MAPSATSRATALASRQNYVGLGKLCTHVNWLLLAGFGDDDVAIFTKKLNLKHCVYTVADTWDILTEENFKMDEKMVTRRSGEIDEEECVQAEDLTDIATPLNATPGFENYNTYDANE
ncbi:hypothetical protein FQA39_LY15650 [Lamprigera yunnana]|nr:hypothetical protein FQA39_LY15650 [Lamprigera yunnana]